MVASARFFLYHGRNLHFPERGCQLWVTWHSPISRLKIPTFTSFGLPRKNSTNPTGLKTSERSARPPTSAASLSWSVSLAPSDVFTAIISPDSACHCSWWRPWTSPMSTCSQWARALTSAPTRIWCACRTTTATTRRRPSASIISRAKVARKHCLLGQTFTHVLTYLVCLLFSDRGLFLCVQWCPEGLVGFLGQN